MAVAGAGHTLILCTYKTRWLASAFAVRGGAAVAGGADTTKTKLATPTLCISRAKDAAVVLTDQPFLTVCFDSTVSNLTGS